MFGSKATPLVVAGALFMVTAPAHALVKVTNETDATHSVTFDHGVEENRHELAPGDMVEEACPTGCGVRFAGHDFTAVDGNELAIEEGATRPTLKN
ncbi:hypothetical protein FP2506_16599 [Fulvimarina pelagi HTCC2506]|uniref:Uncharacterized protein n=1 Tax=Fulvimarina pelagi HTCC2506 TaxID=314231 RepID=Q0FYK4_9HYPH|nr:hypothetical protein [Fulvimarina pelagi]EAU39991.1 hypothetical protein FP2506_02080 [Fulvimarina pelagi HTCC2506]EAU42071.1 hypothetical protein FP2506_16599 [Fulvimarina pelagi HTCC2506]